MVVDLARFSAMAEWTTGEDRCPDGLPPYATRAHEAGEASAQFNFLTADEKMSRR
jgi:hypothetical protein